jgi:hypothetical protein
MFYERLTMSIVPPLSKPRWKPFSSRQALYLAAGAIAFCGVGAIAVSQLKPKGMTVGAALLALNPLAKDDYTPYVSTYDGSAKRADAKLQRSGRSPIAGGLLTIPPSFASDDGGYNLVIHLHGNTDLVEESFAVAEVNAVVVIMNLGIGSGAYEDRFSIPATVPDITERVRSTLGKRGLKNPVQRKLAFTAWSAGYGGVVRTLENPALANKVDAVILLDGIHAAYKPGSTTEVAMPQLVPFQKFAEKAVLGERFFLITHSDIEPGEYAGTKASTSALMTQLGLERQLGGIETTMPPLSSIEGVVPKKKLLALKPTSYVQAGNFFVQGYTGETPEHHMAHLIQMATIALPKLTAHWAVNPAPAMDSEPLDPHAE